MAVDIIRETLTILVGALGFAALCGSAFVVWGD